MSDSIDRKKRSDSELSSTDEDGPVMWDAEEDHLLSYFLGEGGQANGGIANNFPVLTEGNSRSNAYKSKGVMMPSTPAVQFYPNTAPGTASAPQPAPLQLQPYPHQHYHPVTHQQHGTPVISNSSSGSSLSSMAATLVHGGPMLPQHHHAQSHAPASTSPVMYNTLSPISPAAVIGTGQENLMLPPPPRYAVDTDKQQHLQWLQQVNSMVMQVPSYPQHIVPQPYGGYPLAPSFEAQRPAPSLVESEEKRAKRLARNRESARQSRRRKKEHLVTLSKKVNQLQDVLEKERRASLATMDVALKEKRARIVAEFVDGGVIHSDYLEHVIRETLPNSNVKQGTILFQYTTLKQALLPKYEEFILWLTLREEEFFTKGKDERTKAEPNRAAASGRVSSKQIGEELTKLLSESEDGLECEADDLTKLWPLFCFEHSISVDQEEKLLQFYKRSVQNQNLPNDRLQLADATRMVTNMNKGMSFQSHAVGMRSENTLLRTLTPEQMAKYLDWCEHNKERCQRVLQERAKTRKALSKLEDAKTINDMCKRLDDALRLPERDVIDEDE